MQASPRNADTLNCCAAVDLRIQNVTVSAHHLGALPGPYQLTQLSINTLQVHCDVSRLLWLQLPTVRCIIDGVSIAATFRLWPPVRRQAERALTPAHRYQIAAMDSLLQCGRPPVRRTWLVRSMQSLLLPLLAKAFVSVRHVRISAFCAHSWSLHQPSGDGAAEQHGETAATPSGGKAIELSVESACLAPPPTLDLRLLPQPHAEEAVALGAPVCALQVSGVSILAREEMSPDMRPSHQTYILKRWGFEVASHVTTIASGAKAPVLSIKARTHAIVATADAVSLRTLRTFAASLGAHGRYSLYRAARPRCSVQQNVRAWWKHAVACVVRHLREIARDSRLPVRCLKHLKTFSRAYKSHKLQTSTGVLGVFTILMSFSCCNAHASARWPSALLGDLLYRPELPSMYVDATLGLHTVLPRAANCSQCSSLLL
jgi:Vacuolar sorting-associated protein 13, N-terminal